MKRIAPVQISSVYIYCIQRMRYNVILYCKAIYSEWLEFRYCISFDEKIRPDIDLSWFLFIFVSKFYILCWKSFKIGVKYMFGYAGTVISFFCGDKLMRCDNVRGRHCSRSGIACHALGAYLVISWNVKLSDPQVRGRYRNS